MRNAVLLIALLAACGDPGSSPPPAGDGKATGPLPVLSAQRVEKGTSIRIDAKMGDPAWRRSHELKVRLAGAGVNEVKLKAAYDDERFYLLAVWKDKTKSLNRMWEYVAKGKFEQHTGEDAFSILWSPGATAAAFRTQGCAMFCHDGKRHVYPVEETGFVDGWFWGAHQTGFKTTLRDLWMPFGANQRLRGDSQPAGSDNQLNLSHEFVGPGWAPKRVGAARNPLYLPSSNIQPLTKEKLDKLDPERNKGWKIPVDIQRPIRGSRGDVACRALYLKDTWVLEMARKLDTGHKDDLPLGDRLVTFLFAVAIHDDSEGGRHAISGPVELRFVVPR